ncbi:MarR family winged helix-turn-helix transcriptional regulator [Amnibacterium setariae]|uniref:MarR family winged helix-turn-helix transcriptional regulator n=1 Tax=Amnibacterium setariae TaxID=2306585 RepID=UPI0013142BA0|nr:MarR family winged helix-turn-helix transcriptional regulator [Amnibacterium setariae]
MDGPQAAGRRESPTVALLALASIAERRLEAELRSRRLTLRKYAVLGHIAGTAQISYSEIARRSGITVQSAHALVRALIDEGLVEAAETGTGVAAHLSVSAGGRDLLDEMAAAVERLDAELFAGPPLAPLEEALRRAAREGPPRR